MKMKKLFLFFLSLFIMSAILRGQTDGKATSVLGGGFEMQAAHRINSSNTFAPISITSITENFDGEICFPNTWQIESVDGLLWTCSQTQKVSGLNSLYFTPIKDGSPTTGSASIIFPELNLSTSEDVKISFKYRMHDANGNGSPHKTELAVYTSTDGIAYTLLGEKKTESVLNWIDFNVSIPSSVKYVKITAEYVGMGGPGFVWIDDLDISGTPVSSEFTPIFENFDGTDCFPDTWGTKSDADLTWVCDETRAVSGTKSLYFNPTTMGYASLLLPALDLSKVEDAEFSFKYYITGFGGNPNHKTILEVFVSTTDVQDASFSQLGTTITGSQSEWLDFSQALASNVKYIKIKGEFGAGGGPGSVWIDDLLISGTPSSPSEGLSSVSEDFENQVPPTDWTMTAGTGGGIWLKSNGMGDPSLAPRSVKKGEFAAAFIPTADTEDERVTLISPELNLTSHASATLRFWYWNIFSRANTSALTVSTSTDGSTYTQLAHIDDNAAGEWKEYEYPLAKAVKYVKFETNFTAMGGPTWTLIDDLFIGSAASPIVAVDSVFESFEGIAFPPKDWKLETNRADGKSWSRVDTLGYTGSASVVSPPEYFGAKASTFTSPLLDLTSEDNPVLSFYYKNKGEVNAPTPSSHFVIETTSDGIVYTQVGKIPVGSDNKWKPYVQFIDKASTRVKISIISRTGTTGETTYTFLDDLYIGKLTSEMCVLPKNLKTINKTDNSISIGWDALGSAQQWEIGYTTATNPQEEIFALTTSNPYTISNLSPDMYYIRVRSICGAKDTGYWTELIVDSIVEKCPTPKIMKASANTHTEIRLVWNKVPSVNQYIVELSAIGQSAKAYTVSDTNFIASDLIPNTSYQIRLRSYCGVGDSSKWISIQAKTDCIPFSEEELPWTMGFEGISVAGELPGCMEWTKHDWNDRNTPVSTKINASSAHSGSKHAHFSAADGNSSKNDDYLWMPKFDLKAAHTYRLSFWYALSSSAATNIYNIETKMGTVRTKEGMSIRIGDSIVVDTLDTKYRHYIAEFTPENDGSYFIGIHTITPDFLAVGLNVDDIVLERVFTCVTPSAMSVNMLATSADIQWTTSAEKSQIRYGKTDAQGFTEASKTMFVTDLTINIADLLPETQYGVQVRAICADGDTSGWTVMTNFTTLPTCVAPTQLIVSDFTTTGFSIDWTKGGNENKWELSIGEGRVGVPTTPYITSDVNSYVASNLKPNRYYTIHLRANCAMDDQSAWIVDTVSTLCGAEAFPYSEGFEQITYRGELPLCLTTTSNDNIVSYIGSMAGTTLRPHTGNAFVYFLAGSNDWMYTPAFDLKAGHEYEFSTYWLSDDTISNLSLMYGTDNTAESMQMITEVRNDAAISDYVQLKGRFIPVADGLYHLAVYGQSGVRGKLNIDDLAFNEVFTCLAPTALKTFDVTSRAARLQWTAQADSFALSYRITDNINDPFTVVNVKDTAYLLTGLTSNTNYTWKVKSLCPFGNSEEVSTNFRTSEVLCAMPTETNTSDITYDEAKFTWASQGVKFELRFKPDTAQIYRMETVLNAKTFTALSLNSNDNYTWSIRNVCTENTKSEWTSPVAFKTLVQPCTPPVALSSENITGTEAKLSWVSNESNFQVRYKIESEADFILKGLRLKQLTLTNLSPKTAYVWEVRAICAENDTSEWADDSFTTEPLSIEIGENKKLHIYTNNGSIVIYNPAQSHFQKIEVVNISGQVVKSLGATSNASIEIPEIKMTGIYMLRLISSEGVVQSHKLIIK